MLMDRQLRKAPHGVERMNVMFAVSKVLRLARKELKGKSKYGEPTETGVCGVWESGGVCTRRK